MKKIKRVLMTLAITTAMFSAFATKFTDPCELEQQYYYYNGQYYAVPGELGVAYVCVASGAVCTYYKPDPAGAPNEYGACASGTYTDITGAARKSK